MTRFGLGVAGLSAALSVLASNAQAQSATAALIPHRAVYELSMVSANGTRAPSAARGMIAYDFAGSHCDGYTTTFRQMMELAPSEGPIHVTDMRSTTFEDGEFKSFRFKVKTLNDGQPSDDVDGNANRAADGAISIRLSRPKLTKIDFSTGILFPTEHMEHMIRAAKAGETTISRQVYDGSDTGQKLYDTLTVIGKETKAEPPEAPAQNAALHDIPRWPVTVSYFEAGKENAKPSYVLSFDLYENGVSRNLKLDYGDFVLKGELTSFETKGGAVECKK